MQNYPDNRSNGWRRIIAFLDDAKKAPVWLTLILGAIGSLPLVFLTPPFQVSDEVQHFYRAYQLSEFHILAEVQNGMSGGTLPNSLTRLITSFDYAAKGLPLFVSPAPLAATFHRDSIPLQSENRHFVEFPGSAFYSPLPYVPQVLGILLGRLLGLGPLYLLFLGRLFNCLAALGLLALAVYWMPVAPEIVMIVGLLPMSLFQYASVSPDAILIACAMAFTALSLSASIEGKWKTRSLVFAIIAGSVICSVKPPYAPLLLAGVMPGILEQKKAAGVIRSHLILLASALGVALAWLFFTHTRMTSPLGGGHPTAQLAFVAHHPATFAHVIFHCLSPTYVTIQCLEAIGILGWVTILLQPVYVYCLPLIGIGIAWKLGSPRKTRHSFITGLWHAAITITVIFLVLTAMYLMSTKVGQTTILGVQGRYFLPVLALAGIALLEFLPGLRPPVHRWPAIVALSVIILAQIVSMDATIIGVFHVL